MKKTNLLFLILFCLMTFAPVPVFYAFREQIGYSNTENKAESDFPELNRGNYSTWPKRFESWLSDTLPFKTQFIRIFRGAQLTAGTDFTQSDVIRGKSGFLFYRATVENYKGLTRFSAEELETVWNCLNEFFEPLEEQGIQCLLFIAPDKEQVLSEYMPESIRRISEISRGDQLAARLKEQADFPILYPKPELTALAQTQPIYFLTDTHWNDLGGYYAAQLVKGAFSGTVPNLETPSYSYYPEPGKDLAKMLGLSDKLQEPLTVLVDWDDGIKTRKTQTIDYGTVQRFKSDTPGKKKLLIIGDSFSEYLLRSAIHDYSEVLFVTYGELYRIDLEAEAPDAVIVMLVERNLPFLLNGFY